MDPANVYALVTLLHLGADIVFVASLLAATFVLAVLGRQSTAQLRRDARLVGGLRRWHRHVAGAALALAWLCGLWLAWRAGWWRLGWLHAKLVVVLALSALHGLAGAALRRAGADTPAAPSRAWLASPALVLGAVAAVVWLAWTKPF